MPLAPLAANHSDSTDWLQQLLQGEPTLSPVPPSHPGTGEGLPWLPGALPQLLRTGCRGVTTASFLAGLLHSGNLDWDSATEAGSGTAHPGPCGAQGALPGLQVLPGGQHSHPRGPEGPPVPPWTLCRCLGAAPGSCPQRNGAAGSPRASHHLPVSTAAPRGEGAGPGARRAPEAAGAAAPPPQPGCESSRPPLAPRLWLAEPQFTINLLFELIVL